MNKIFDPEKSKILIQEWKDKETEKPVIMEISVMYQNGKIFFELTETPFVMEVKKPVTE